MNFGAMRTTVLAALGLPSTDARLDATTLKALGNLALHDIEVIADWPYLEAIEDIALTSGGGPPVGAYPSAETTYLRTISARLSAQTEPLKPVSVEDVELLQLATGT